MHLPGSDSGDCSRELQPDVFLLRCSLPHVTKTTLERNFGISNRFSSSTSFSLSRDGEVSGIRGQNNPKSPMKAIQLLKSVSPSQPCSIIQKAEKLLSGPSCSATKQAFGLMRDDAECQSKISKVQSTDPLTYPGL